MAFRSVTQSRRFWVYLISSVTALAIALLLGKDVMWDTLDYHLYAGFSALHDRFGQDYFAAGTQSYFNPYVYVPYYLLAMSGLSAKAVSCVLALVQGGILWLTYELALSVIPAETRATRAVMAIFAVAMALANPILIDQLGTSYVDIITGEFVLSAWLLLVGAIRAPGMARVLGAGLLLGVVSALKLTNSVHAVAACALLCFMPAGYAARARYATAFCAAVAVSFAVVMFPWSIHLERHFGSPVFPLFNGLFQSPQFPTASIRDHRFVPDSFIGALLRPFAIAAPVTMTDDEFAAPDLRYAVLVVLIACVFLRWAWRKYMHREQSGAGPDPSAAWRAFWALGCGFLLDWILWLSAVGIGRYFIPMACVAAVLAAGLLLRLFRTRWKTGAYVLAAILGLQVFELCAGATYRAYVPWDGGAPFELSLPRPLTAHANLYLTLGEESVSFLAPYLAPASGLVDLEGDYVLGPQGASGAHLKALITRYSPHLRVLVLDPRLGKDRGIGLPDAAHVNDTLAHFGLRASNDCLTIVLKDVRQPFQNVLPGSLPIPIRQLKGGMLKVPVSPNRDLMSCKVMADDSSHASLFAGDRKADLVLDRLEDACPMLFQPNRPLTEDFGDEQNGYYRMRRYDSTGLAVMITKGAVMLFDPVRGGRPIYLGQEAEWAKAAPRLVCGRRHESYYARVLPGIRSVN